MKGLAALIIRPKEECVIGIGGALLSLKAGEPLVYPAPQDEETVFTVWGRPGGSCIPEAHRLSMEDGAVKEATLPVTDWGGAAEIEVRPRSFKAPLGSEPKTIAETGWFSGDRRAKAELYSDNGLRLAVTEDGGDTVSFPLCEGTGGSLRTVDFGFARLLAVRAVSDEGERLILINRDREKVFEAAGDRADISEGAPTVIESLGTVRGHERRTKYEYSAGAFVPVKVETGFFTHDANELKTEARIALAAVEEAKLGLPSWREALSEELDGMLGENGLIDFLGCFGRVGLYPLEEGAGRVTLGLFGEGEGNISRPRKILFTFREGRIDDIEEL